MNELKEKFHDSIDTLMELAQDDMDMTGCQLHEVLPLTDLFPIEIDGVTRYVKLEIKILR